MRLEKYEKINSNTIYTYFRISFIEKHPIGLMVGLYLVISQNFYKFNYSSLNNNIYGNVRLSKFEQRYYL